MLMPTCTSCFERYLGQDEHVEVNAHQELRRLREERDRLMLAYKAEVGMNASLRNALEEAMAIRGAYRDVIRKSLHAAMRLVKSMNHQFDHADINAVFDGLKGLDKVLTRG